MKSMFRFGSGKVATVFVKALELSRRTLADDDDDDRLVADFTSCYGFADPEWELPEYIALLLRPGCYNKVGLQDSIKYPRIVCRMH